MVHNSLLHDLVKVCSKYRGYYVIEHGGAVPGQMSQVMRMPGAGVGIAIMVNDNEFQSTGSKPKIWSTIRFCTTL
jgi:hypothetical protein